MKYIDSNVFIAPVVNSSSDSLAIASKEILIKIAEGSLSAATCTLTWDELTWSIRKKLGMEIAKIEGKRFLEFPNLKLLEVKENTLSMAQELTEKYNLKPRDAIHAACCMENNIEEIMSDDSDFNSIRGLKRVGLKSV